MRPLVSRRLEAKCVASLLRLEPASGVPSTLADSYQYRYGGTLAPHASQFEELLLANACCDRTVYSL